MNTHGILACIDWHSYSYGYRTSAASRPFSADWRRDNKDARARRVCVCPTVDVTSSTRFRRSRSVLRAKCSPAVSGSASEPVLRNHRYSDCHGRGGPKTTAEGSHRQSYFFIGAESWAGLPCSGMAISVYRVRRGTRRGQQASRRIRPRSIRRGRMEVDSLPFGLR